MVSAPAVITPNSPGELKGKVVTIFADFTSGGAAQVDDIDLPTDAPKIDLTVENPVLNVVIVTLTTPTNTINSPLALQVTRGTNGDSNGEWDVSDADSITVYHTADESGVAAVTYIAAGAQVQ